MHQGRLVSLPLRLAGWRFEGEKPRDKKYVCIAWPHTSNWDGLLLVALTRSVGLSISWMIKKEWVSSPLGLALRPLGAVPIDRSGSHHVVQDMIDAFAREEELVLVIPPEGTRKRSDYWRSGFYRIALGAGVPIVPGYLDYEHKRAGLGEPIRLTGDVKADMDAIRAFYGKMQIRAVVPENVGPIRLRDEEDGSSAR